MFEIKLWSWNDGDDDGLILLMVAVNNHAIPWSVIKICANAAMAANFGQLHFKKNYMVNFANKHGYSANPHVEK